MSKQNLTMIIAGIILAGALAFLSMSQGNTPTAKSSSPQISITPLSHDFGTVKASDGFVKSIFTVKNTGDGELNMARITTSCACTTAKVDSKKLSPGETTELRVIFDPNYHKNTFGPILREIYIRSNDPNNSEVVLELKGRVIK